MNYTPSPVSSWWLPWLSTGEHERFTGSGGGLRWGAAARETDTDREIWRGREQHGETGDRQGLISTSSSSSSKPASRLQRIGRTQHVPSRSELPVCRQDFPRGPGTVRRHQENNYAERGERCARSQLLAHKDQKGKMPAPAVLDMMHEKP